MARSSAHNTELDIDLPVKVDVSLFVSLMSSALAKVGAGNVVVDDVSGGFISFSQGGHTTEIPVHVCLSYTDLETNEHTDLYFTFKGGTVLTIPKRLFQLSTEASRQQLVAEMIRIGLWQIKRKAEGVLFKFRNSLQTEGKHAGPITRNYQFGQSSTPKPTLQSDSVPLALQRPARKNLAK